MQSLPARAAAAAFVFAVAAVAGCGSIITVPDQGVVVIGCRSPAACFVSDCSCIRGDVVKGYCTVPEVCSNPLDPSTCVCPQTYTYPEDMKGAPPGDMSMSPRVATIECLETPQACVGRGVFCGGTGARCLPSGGACTTSGGDPPQLIPTGGTGPSLEPHCEFVDDVCCPGTTPADLGVITD